MRIPRRPVSRVWMAGVWAFVLGLAAAVLVLTTAQIESKLRRSHEGLVNGFISRLDTTAYDWLFANRGPQPLISDVVIVELSDRAINNLVGMPFQGNAIRFPFPRALHGELLRKLKAEGAKVIAPDITFLGSSGYGDADDHALAAALRDCGNVILAADFSQSRTGEMDDLANEDQFPYKPLRDACLDFAPVNLVQDADHAIRRFDLTRTNLSLTNVAQDEEYPSFAARVAGASVGLNRKTLAQQFQANKFDNGTIKYAPDDIAVDVPGKTVRINYAGYPQAILCLCGIR